MLTNSKTIHKLTDNNKKKKTMILNQGISKTFSASFFGQPDM